MLLHCLGVNTRLGLTHLHTAAIKIALPSSSSLQHSSRASMVQMQPIALPVVATPLRLWNCLLPESACDSSCDILIAKWSKDAKFVGNNTNANTWLLMKTPTADRSLITLTVDCFDYVFDACFCGSRSMTEGDEWIVGKNKGCEDIKRGEVRKSQSHRGEHQTSLFSISWIPAGVRTF